MARNLAWSKDEITLALELYFSSDRGPISSSNPKIIELSLILNRLKATSQIIDQEKFRNPNGICLKLSNFLALDPEYLGKGMTSYSKLDKELFDKYRNNFFELKKDAFTIKKKLL